MYLLLFFQVEPYSYQVAIIIQLFFYMVAMYSNLQLTIVLFMQ